MRLPLPATLPRNCVHLTEARLSRSLGLLPALRETLDEAERARADRFVHAADRARLTLGRGLARHALAALMGLRPQEIRFGVTGEGKPVVESGPAFNVSHSGDLVLVAIASSGRLGVDVELTRPLRDLESLARTTFRPEEVAAVLAAPAVERADAFYRVWTRKEAILKALGHGLTALDSIQVSAAASGPTLLSVELSGESASEWSLRTLHLDPQHAAAIAYDGPIDELRSIPV